MNGRNDKGKQVKYENELKNMNNIFRYEKKTSEEFHRTR